MYGEGLVKTNVTKVAPTTFALGLVAESSHRFHVEEAEMLVSLEFEGTLNATVGEQPVDFTLMLDTTTDVATLGPDGAVQNALLVDGIAQDTFPVTAGLNRLVRLNKTVRLAKGEHKIALAVRAAAGNVLVMGLLRPARRIPANAVNAANQNSRQAAGTY